MGKPTYTLTADDLGIDEESLTQVADALDKAGYYASKNSDDEHRGDTENGN